MDSLIAALTGILVAPQSLFLVLLGTILGVVVGAIPSLNGAMLIALTLPLTYTMRDIHALVLLVAMYVGSIAGGLITATLLRMPGTPANVVTTFDGYPMARRGQPGRALGFGITASLVGGLISWGFLVTLTEPLSDLGVKFGPFEYFALVLMALVLIASVSQGNFVKGILSGFFGMLVAMPGVDPSFGQERLTFGFFELSAGLNLLPVLIGVFVVGQALTDVLEIDRKMERIPLSHQGLFMTLHDWGSQAVNLIRSSVIGTWVGILPGVGASIGSVIAYTTARNMSKTPEAFGTGFEDGIVASEAANNATVGGALIPLVALGIPGSIIDAILLGALFLHSVQPGPLLFITRPDVVYSIMAACLIANIVMFLFMTGAVGMISKIVFVRRGYLLPAILVFCVIGTYSLSNRMFDVWVMLAFGVIGFALERVRVPLGPFIIGLVLAPIAEQSIRSGLMLSGGSYWPMVTRPFSLTFLVVSLALLLWPLYREARDRRRES